MQRNGLSPASDFAGDGGTPVAEHGSDPFPCRGELEGGVQSRQQSHDLGPGKRQVRVSTVEKAMTKRIDLVAVYMGDGSVRADDHITAEELDADHGAGFDLAGQFLRFGRSARHSLLRFQAQLPEGRRKSLECTGRETRESQRREDFNQIAEACRTRVRASSIRGERFGMSEHIPVESETGSARGEFGVRDHLVDGLDTSNSLFGKRETESHSTEQLTLNIDWTATHPLHDTGLSEGAAGELGQDDALFWSQVFEDTEDLDLEVFHPVPVEDCAAYTTQSGANVLQREESLSVQVLGRANEESQGEQPCQSYNPRIMNSLTHINHCFPRSIVSLFL